MTLLLYDYKELEERAGRHLKAWKVWHLILYGMAAIFGIANYILLQSAMQLVDNHCILYPRNLSFHMVPRSEIHVATHLSDNESYFKEVKNDAVAEAAANSTKALEKREVAENITADAIDDVEITDDIQNTTILTGYVRQAPSDPTITELYIKIINVHKRFIIRRNWTHRWALDTSRSLFGRDSDCQFAEYMPIMSAVCAIVWLTLFTMCPGGGRPRSGLKQPWRILTPALLSALVLTGLTGHGFARTNAGLQDFCAAFANYTNSTKCSSVGPLLEREWATSWGWGGRAASVRGASAGAWAAWACAAALLLARCLAAPDFRVRRTTVHLVKDPQGKLAPHLRNRRSRSPRRSAAASPRSQRTATTDLPALADDSAPTSLMATPIKRDQPEHLIEMSPRNDSLQDSNLNSIL
ncbi:hypothetical protein ACJJTC_009245 [Scirpophaga incertulas]